MPAIQNLKLGILTDLRENALSQKLYFTPEKTQGKPFLKKFPLNPSKIFMILIYDEKTKQYHYLRKVRLFYRFHRRRSAPRQVPSEVPAAS